VESRYLSHPLPHFIKRCAVLKPISLLHVPLAVWCGRVEWRTPALRPHLLVPTRILSLRIHDLGLRPNVLCP